MILSTFLTEERRCAIIITVTLPANLSVPVTSAVKRRANYLHNIGHVRNSGLDQKEVRLLAQKEESVSIEQILNLAS